VPGDRWEGGRQAHLMSFGKSLDHVRCPWYASSEIGSDIAMARCSEAENATGRYKTQAR
jgi:hypothetical protein